MLFPPIKFQKKTILFYLYLSNLRFFVPNVKIAEENWNLFVSNNNNDSPTFMIILCFSPLFLKSTYLKLYFFMRIFHLMLYFIISDEMKLKCSIPACKLEFK